MKLLVYKATYHYIVTAPDGHEVSRTSPETLTVGAKDEREAAKLLPQVPGKKLMVLGVQRLKGVDAVTVS
jgi:hypothetical protein